MLPSAIVNIIRPLHSKHVPCNGGLLYFSLHPTQRNCCDENFLKLPLMSRMKCRSMISRATSRSSTARIFSATSICFSTFSFMVGMNL